MARCYRTREMQALISVAINQVLRKSPAREFLVTAADNSANEIRIWKNNVFSSGVSTLSPATYLQEGYGLSVMGNDLEANYGGIIFAGIIGAELSGNYIENSRN